MILCIMFHVMDGNLTIEIDSNKTWVTFHIDWLNVNTRNENHNYYYYKCRMVVKYCPLLKHGFDLSYGHLMICFELYISIFLVPVRSIRY